MLCILADSQSWIYGGKRDDEFDFRPAKFGGHSGREFHQTIGFESLKFSARIKSVYRFESQQLVVYLPLAIIVHFTLTEVGFSDFPRDKAVERAM